MTGYKSNTLQSKVMTDNFVLNDDSSLVDFLMIEVPAAAIGLFFFDHEVVWGKWSGKQFQFAEHTGKVSFKYLQQLRLFNNNEELFMWRHEEGRFLWRHRLDGQGDEFDVIDAMEILQGEKRESQAGFNLYEESAGAAGWVPVSLSGSRIALKVRNYVNQDSAIAGFVDTRFVSLEEVS